MFLHGRAFMRQFRKRRFIINSLLDTDFYKFTMGYLVFKLYRLIPVLYALKNRTITVPLARFISESELRRQLDHVRHLRFRSNELHFIKGTYEYDLPMFADPAYIEFLAGLTLPPYWLVRAGDSYEITVSGHWAEAIYWETFILSIVNELYYRALMKKMSAFERHLVYAEGMRRLGAKIKLLREHPGIRFSDFGTRRRFSRAWQDYVVGVLSRELGGAGGQFVGTSNVHLAMKYGLTPIGTSAHEMYMVMSGIMHGSDDDIRASHNKVLQCWWTEFGWGLSIALTDTYGTPFFFTDMTPEQARNWKGLRQDSGDPFDFGECAIAFYTGLGIDPKEKMIVFSDGLDVETIMALFERFNGRIKVTFGWGTDLTNDLGFGSLSLVVKAVEACGHGLVKLSDNLAKAIGALDDVERFKRIFGHTATFNQTCRS
ncbi:MAG: nicotinate phosphoribosyltransferase [Candidatus Sungbacteria bacterium RIFCSPLOWO2_02_FULL_51_17]|uniref:Nicotinate phosphoribosyltransferase n=1 Tax=Candidatus Sungbacteria bacterium RIFCSPHIGHO2_02_FULL_51_29 TaxID=1802273 RepID=A0A1G2L034_9BACT|nr:MAG: nicotinate phosphoribosyltransferase [Candidatus Sungbacteria bacterium RIFCSPHIGHO2_02_FULL_51_29]OHA04768.1 MAG: nicotinate phosphoribosyltransferase [Candidatus Sungbacteria bacterium RIFCSPLOWO2_01_FULL_51_34]OHA12038.1 MAG: nicotinate phosphoribosyltransferase [Candidatus Sungbacteria bacterium RIFCSPLOWO2_02_FULL_51_17]